MAVPTPLCDRLIVVGANHRTSSLDLRDRLFADDPSVPGFLRSLAEAGVAEAILLSTCDRVEVVAVSDRDDAAESIVRVMAGHAGLALVDIGPQIFVARGADALRHVFAVAAALESQVIGEPQVLGQVKAAHRLARAAGLSAGTLDLVLQAAYAAAKRVRTETKIGEGPVSIAAAAKRIAHDLFGDFEGLSAILIGSGDMGGLVTESLMEAGLRNFTVIDPLPARGEAVAARLGCHLAEIGELARLLPQADIVIGALGNRRPVLTAERVRLALEARRRRPAFLIDAAVPGDVEPAVDRLDGAFLYDLGDLERVALEGRAGRQAEAESARRIIDEEVTTLMRGDAERTAVPSLIVLRRHFEEARRQALAAAGGDAEKATRLLVNRLLHAPSQAMRAVAASTLRAAETESEWERMDALLRRLFGLDEKAESDDKENSEK